MEVNALRETSFDAADVERLEESGRTKEAVKREIVAREAIIGQRRREKGRQEERNVVWMQRFESWATGSLGLSGAPP